MMSWYMTAKDFAAPVATILAASAAAYVTVAIQQQNLSVARNRLKLDLFERRYEVYTATRDLLLLVVENPDLSEPAVKADFIRIYLKMTEAPFVCGARAQAFCLKARATEDAWRAYKWRAATADSMPPGPERADAVLAPGKALSEIMILLDRIVPAFSDDLWIGWPDRRRRGRQGRDA